MHQHGDCDAGEGRAAELLREYDRAKRIHFGAAIFGRIADAEEAKFAHAAQHLARHAALLSHFSPCGLISFSTKRRICARSISCSSRK